jgi:iron(III) transport system substrate-binding protein
VDLLYLVAVVRKGTPVPKTWHDLTGPAYRGAVALPDPAFAASALGMLGYFSSADGYGLDYYRALKANGAVQLKSPDDVLTGVARGTYWAGFTLANAAYLAKKKGSPIEVVWPLPGAVAIYAPIAVTKKAGDRSLAEQFAAYVASPAGQQVVAKTNVYPVLPGVGGPEVPSGAPVAAPDWPVLFGSRAELSAQYRTIFGG